MSTVLLTDHAWPDDAIERDIFAKAGHVLISGPAEPGSEDEITALAAQYQPQAIMTCWARVGAEAIRSCPDLRIVARMGVGLDNIDVGAAVTQGAVVTNVPDYCVEEVSDHAVAMILSWARGIVSLDREVKAGRWDPTAADLRRVCDLTVGIAGFGRIGRRTAQKLHEFGCRVLALAHGQSHPGSTGAVTMVALEGLLAESDVVVIHLPLTNETLHMFNEHTLRAMRPGAFLVNTSRGPLVQNDALLAVLDDAHLSGAALDVIEGEPNPPRALTGHARVIATPHVAFASTASVRELRRRAAEEVVRVLRGDAAEHLCTPAGVR